MLACASVYNLRVSPYEWFAPSVTADFPEENLISGSFYLRVSQDFAKNPVCPFGAKINRSLPYHPIFTKMKANTFYMGGGIKSSKN